MYRWCSKCNKKLVFHQTNCDACGQQADIEMDIGDTLRIDSKREFQITRQLSHFSDAGMSAVYLAQRSDRPDMRGAIKVAKLNKSTALKREAEMLQQLRHTHIIRLAHPERALWQDRKGDERLFFFALEYMDSGSLKDRLKQYNKLPLGEATRIIMAVGEALNHTHQRGVVHLDVKPANILFNTNGRIVLSDFGIARDVTQLKMLKKRVGTLFYNSPEQLTDSPEHTPKADIYALGVILYEMLVGASHFSQYRSSSSRDKNSSRGGSRPKAGQQRYPDLPPPRHFNRAIPTNVEQVILKAIAPDPTQRYNSVTLLMADLANAVSNPVNQKKRGLLLAIGGLGAMMATLLIVLGVIFFAFRASLPAAATRTTVPVTDPGATEVAATNDTRFISVSTSAPQATATNAGGNTTGDSVSMLKTPQVTSTPKNRSTPTSPPTTNQAVSQATIDGTIELITPDDNLQVAGSGTQFRWIWQKNKGCLSPPPGYGFEIRIWLDRENIIPSGVMNAKDEKENILCDPGTGIRSFTVDVKEAMRVKGWNSGRFLWDVALVRLAPYKPVITPAAPRLLYF